ncbi:MAG: polyphosphate polymerase domain-containing protein [Cellulosilyticum sp.]|nr:polyphosphate polymerase domain-containing protein [Cellulosilyticum sp.]
MIKSKYIIQRVEKKYMLTKDEYNWLLEELEPHISMDAYGKHTIGNIYYDTDTYELIRYSIEKPKYKEKLRLRSYGIPNTDSDVYLEIKKKYDGIVYKRRVDLTLAEAEAYLNEGMRPQKDSQILREIDYFISYYKPKPKLYLAYDRMAYFGREDSSVRITFDHNIRSREYDLSLGKGDYGVLLLDEDRYLMEIKVAGAMPIWLSEILSKLAIYPSSFSKYGNVYKKSILLDRREELCLQAY